MRPSIFPSDIFPRSNANFSNIQQNVDVNNKNARYNIQTNTDKLMNELELIERDNVNDIKDTNIVKNVVTTQDNQINDEDHDKKSYQLEAKVIKQLEEFLSKSENAYTNQKTELVNLINETLSEKHNNLKSYIEETVKKSFSSQDYEKSYNTHFNQMNDHYLTRSNNMNNLPYQPMQFPSYNTPRNMDSINIDNKERETSDYALNENKKTGKKTSGGGKYYKLPKNLWESTREMYPDLPETLESSAYIKGDEKFIKLKNTYIKINDIGVAKINSKMTTS